MLGRRTCLVAALALVPAGNAAANEQKHDRIEEVGACFAVAPCLGCQRHKLPIVIDRPGVYRLCRDLVVADANTTAIEVQADDVTIDLDGHTIAGPVKCSQRKCVGAGTGLGISANDRDNLTVLNGTVRGMGDSGIVGGRHARIQAVKALSNGRYGIVVGRVGLLSGNVASDNGGTGLSGSEYTSFKDNVVQGNAASGIATGCACSVVGNLVINNGGSGIVTGGETACINNSLGDNANKDLQGCTGIQGTNLCGFVTCP